MADRSETCSHARFGRMAFALLCFTTLVSATLALTLCISCVGPCPWTFYLLLITPPLLMCALTGRLAASWLQQRTLYYPRLYWFCVLFVSTFLLITDLPYAAEPFDHSDFPVTGQPIPPARVDPGYDLRQQPWLVHRSYAVLFRSAFHTWHRPIDKFSSILELLLSILSPLIVASAVCQLWKLRPKFS
jgi:hypothetical protein